jgi:hypothetical protein
MRRSRETIPEDSAVLSDKTTTMKLPKCGRWPMGAAILAGASAQTRVDPRSQAKNVDFSAVPSKPFRTGTALPAACLIGATFFKTDASPGRNFHGCTSANTWTIEAHQELPEVNGQAGRIPTTDGSVPLRASNLGDLYGDVGSLLVRGLQGRAVSSGASADGYPLEWNGTANQWEPRPVIGSVSGDVNGPLFERRRSAAATACGLGRRRFDGQARVWNAVVSQWQPATFGLHRYHSSGLPMLKSTTIRLMVCAGLLEGQPVSHGPRVEGPLDASGATSARPVRAGPAAPIRPCWGGEPYFSTGDAAGQNLYLCQPANVRTQQVSAPYTFRDGLVNCSGTVGGAPDPSLFTLKDDFPWESPGNLKGEMNRSSTAAGASVAAQSGHPGIMSIATTQKKAAGAGLGHSARDAGLGPGTGTDSAWDGGACFGFVHAMGGCVKRSAPAPGIQAMADSTTPSTCSTGAWNTANWMAVSAYSATLVSCVDTGVAANTETWYHFKVSSTTPGRMDLSMNGSSAGSISTNIYSATYSPSKGVAPRSAGGVAKLAWLDYLSFRGRGLTI